MDKYITIKNSNGTYEVLHLVGEYLSVVIKDNLSKDKADKIVNNYNNKKD
jgi:hypothetical protein